MALLRLDRITGRTAIWHEDISVLSSDKNWYDNCTDLVLYREEIIEIIASLFFCFSIMLFKTEKQNKEFVVVYLQTAMNSIFEYSIIITTAKMCSRKDQGF